MARTVLVLGAGASIPYGFPSGVGLIDAILNDFQEVHVAIHRQANPAALNQLAYHLKNEHWESIDIYLKHKEEFTHEIRATIFKVLLHREEGDIRKLGPFDKHGSQNWYGYYFNRLMKDKEAIEKLQPQKVISFNYDRSFEYFLFQFLKGRMGLKDDAEVFKLLHQKFEIHHVHGRLPNLPKEKYFEDDSLEIPYGSKDFKSYISYLKDPQVLKKYLTTVYEQKESKVDYPLIVKNSSRVLFLGFGYLEDNMEKIGVNALKKSASPLMFGTSYKLGRQEIMQLKTNNINVCDNNHYDCLDFFKEFVPAVIY